MRARFLLFVLFTLVLIHAPRHAAHADFVVGTFEDLGLGANTFQNDFSPTGSFMTGGYTLNNSYDSTYGDWSGFAVSTMVDNTFSYGDTDYNHEYGAYAPLGANGTGSGGSATYGIAFNYNQGDAIINMPNGVSPYSIDITNTTYVADSITNGDQFATAFTQGSFFKLDIIGFSGANGTGSQIGDVPFTLASYPEGGSLQLVNTWTTVDLTPLAGSASLEFNLTSSDTGIYGINTPTFFAVDNITGVTVPEPSTVALLGIGLAGMSMIHLRVRRRLGAA